MGSISFSLLPLSTASLPLSTPRRSFQHRPFHLPSSIFLSAPSSSPLASSGSSSKSFSLVRRGASKRGPEESAFFDEDGMVKDMDGYLNYLSLEYDSVWDTKPAWCQPWTIVLTGVTVTTCSWLLLHSTLITAVISSLILAWWYTFLYAYPKAYTDMIADRRKNVSTGIEDTFGLNKNS